MSEMSQNSLPNACGAKTKFGICQRARLNALKTGRYAKSFIKQIELMNNELNRLDELIRNSEIN